MSNSCGGLDSSVPPEVEEALKDHIRRNDPGRQFFDKTDENEDMTYACLLEDCGGKRCEKGKCQYNREGKPNSGHTSHKPIRP